MSGWPDPGTHRSMPVQIQPESPTVSPHSLSQHHFLALSGSLFSTNYIVSVVLHALDSLDLAFGIQVQSKFLTAVSPQHPAQESHSCLHSPCGQDSSWCTQSGVMQPIYDPVHEKEHVSRTCRVHLPGCWKQGEDHSFLWQPETTCFTS